MNTFGCLLLSIVMAVVLLEIGLGMRDMYIDILEMEDEESV